MMLSMNNRDNQRYKQGIEEERTQKKIRYDQPEREQTNGCELGPEAKIM